MEEYSAEDLNKMQEYIDEYEFVIKRIKNYQKRLQKIIENDDLRRAVGWLADVIVDNEGPTYDDYKEKIYEAENDDHDYTNNKGIWESVMRERSKGF